MYNYMACPKDKILNPATNRCVSINGKIGKLLADKMNTAGELQKEKKYVKDVVHSLKEMSQRTFDLVAEEGLNRALRVLFDNYEDDIITHVDKSFVIDVDNMVRMGMSKLQDNKFKWPKDEFWQGIKQAKIKSGSTIGDLKSKTELLRYVFDNVCKIFHGIMKIEEDAIDQEMHLMFKSIDYRKKCAFDKLEELRNVVTTETKKKEFDKIVAKLKAFEF